MKLDNKELHALLTEKEIFFLHHANTASTSITFLEQGGLLSRGAAENKGLHQSIQSSDALDKVFDVWNDTFLDSADLHEYFSRQNYYGPILFKFSIDFLLTEEYDIWITKDNPINWRTNMTPAEKYFSNVKELRDNWDNYQRQKKMLTIKNQTEPILFKYVYQVLVDDPKVEVDGVLLSNEVFKGLKGAITSSISLKGKFKWRECSCFCTSNYRYQVSPQDLKRLFLPKE